MEVDLKISEEAEVDGVAEAEAEDHTTAEDTMNSGLRIRTTFPRE